MKRRLIILLLCVFSISVSAQRITTTIPKQKTQTTLVTKSMADKIASFCLYEQGYGKAVFIQSNSKLLSYSDLAQGKATEILYSLSKYPKYSENFIYGVYKIWGYNGLRQIGFTETEINKAKQIIVNKKSTKE